MGSPRKTVVNRTKNFEFIQEHFEVACEPYFYEHIDPYTKVTTRKKKTSETIDEEKSLMSLVAKFIKQSDKHIKEREHREAKENSKKEKMKQLELIAEKYHQKHAVQATPSKEEATDLDQTQNSAEKQAQDQQKVQAILQDFNVDSDNLEDLTLIPSGKAKETGELDLHDEMLHM